MVKQALVAILLVHAVTFSSSVAFGQADRSDDDALRDRVMRILKDVPLIDGHNDTPGQYRGRVNGHVDQLDFRDTTQLERPMHTDLNRLRAGAVGGQFWSVYIPIRQYGGADGDVKAVLEQIDLTKRLVAAHPDDLEMAYTVDDVLRIHHAGKIASMIGMEGGHSMENSLAALRALYDAGARYMTLTHGKSLRWADSATASDDEPKHGGLTEFGREVVREMNRMGMLVDLSHVSPNTMHDALDVAVAPVIFSHSSTFSKCAHPRNVPDDVLLRLPANGGVIMITFFPSYTSEALRVWMEEEKKLEAELRQEFPDPDDEAPRVEKLNAWREANPAPKPTLEQVADHIDHARSITGINHIGIGSDYDGMPPGPVGLEDVSKYPDLFVELLKRGYSDEDVAKIAVLNVLRVMRDCETVADRVQESRPPSDVLIDEVDGS